MKPEPAPPPAALRCAESLIGGLGVGRGDGRVVEVSGQVLDRRRVIARYRWERRKGSRRNPKEVPRYSLAG